MRIGPTTLFIQDQLNNVDSLFKIKVYIPLNFVRLDFNLGSRMGFLLDLSVRNTLTIRSWVHSSILLIINKTGSRDIYFEELTTPPRQCLRSGSIGSTRFGLPGTGSGSAKICGSTDPDPRFKISTKNCKKLRDHKNFTIAEWFIKF